ncbi:class I SAM-dependent methyltransferase [Candidatus Enterococcus clewellii]|uniref:Methyltransferase domain-containing protein n=1 Tax=Candidatus Enterococcus clewellii TaxID=1834193 RepID=A0A242KAW7_9ENTE|nr:class I SAM-dependent methyltransferase [Enterococcus sp. 9E7_DIV0242]OTP18219.1 hypothetical protein A5888_000031 [Enterococcus sp. 9E7_DIV0242]
MNNNPIISNYSSFDEDQRAFESRAAQIEFIYTKRLLDQYIDSEKTVIELGCGTGYYGLYLSDKCKYYHGIDLVPKHIEQFQSKIIEQDLHHISASLGDATHLPEIQDNSYDVVLVLGPMYHLPHDERQKVIMESRRICKIGGVIMFAYINKIGAYLRACIDENLKADYPNEAANNSVFVNGVDDKLSEVFYFTMPEEMEHDVTQKGLSIVRNAGVDFSFSPTDINRMSDEQYVAWTEIMDYMFASPSCTGTSSHAVLVCCK